MNKSSFFKSLFLFLIFIVPSLQAQDSTAIRKLKSFSQHFITFSKGYPQEKVYLHFDNTSYYLGESIWFKAYAVRADKNSLSNISKVLYVELLNVEGYVLETKKLKLENGECHGDFNLNSTNYGGFYEIRAYTLYMLNFDIKNYFSRVLPVYDNPKVPGEYSRLITERLNSQRIPKIRSDYSSKGSLTMNFFPEGGNLVQGLSSKVAFKVNGKDGESVVVSGSVINEKNEKVADISNEYQDMGSFDFTPGTGKYFAKVYSKDREYKFELPATLPKGYTMAVENMADENMAIYIQRNGRTKGETLGLSISCRGVLYGFDQIDMNTDSILAFKYPKKLLPTGVAQLTLYNASGEILSERLAFVNHQTQLKFTASQSKPTYQPFEKVNLEFQLNDFKNNPVETTFSLAVHDDATNSTNPFADNVMTDLLLSSEISGYIENPALYFQSNDNSHHQALDLLLLTQGWSRYSWKQMAGTAPFVVKHTIEKQLVLDGNVASVLLKKKMKNVDVSMILLSDSVSQQGKCMTDSVGNFNLGLQDFKGEGKLILQSKIKDKRKDTRIMLNRQYSPELKTYSFPELNVTQYIKAVRDSTLFGKNDSTDLIAQKNNSKLSMEQRENLLKEITVKEKFLPSKISLKYDVAKEIDKIEDTGEWEPADIYGFLSKTNKYITTITQANGNTKITYKGKEVRLIRRDSKNFATELSDDNSDNSTSSDNSVNGGNIGNGANGSDANNGFKDQIPLIDEIESVSIVEDYATISRILGGRATDPSSIVLAVITLKKNYQRELLGIRNTTFTGYSYVKEFYSPQYNRFRSPNDRDYRRTLYWNPDVKTDKEGKANVIFFNNASCKTMTINAETVTENGVVGTLNK